MKAKGDPAAGLVQRRDLLPHRPIARQGPLVQAELGWVHVEPAAVGVHAIGRSEARGPLVADVGLRRLQRVPVRRELDAAGLDRDQVPVDPLHSRIGEQLLNDPLRPLVVLLPEVAMPDSPLGVDEVERRPGLVCERPPDGELVVDRDRVFDAHRIEGRLDLLDVVLERELRRVRADHDQSLVPVLPLPGSDVGQRAQPVDAGEGAELDDHHLPPEPGRCERLRIEPGARAVQFRELALDGQLRCGRALHDQRSDLKVARISSEKICGCSQAAKWPPSSTRL